METKKILNSQSNYLYIYPKKFTENPPLSDKKYCHPHFISKKTETQRASPPVATKPVFECRHPKMTCIAELDSHVQVLPLPLNDCKLLNRFLNVSVFMFSLL